MAAVLPLSPSEISRWHALLDSVADEMGVVLGLTAHSPNIRERRDYSCAVFDSAGALVAQAAHIPVHLGAMPEAVAAVRPLAPWSPGDIAILNDPFRGGTHLPDISLVAPVFWDGQLGAFLTNRAHHADIGGMSPGSMPVATEIYQEGIIIPPLRLYHGGVRDDALLALVLANVRTPDERLGDFEAQLAAIRTGERRLQGLLARYGPVLVATRMADLQDYAERLVRHVIAAIPDGEYHAEDVVEVGTSLIPIRLRLTVEGDEATFDFTGSGEEQAASVNAVSAVTRSAVLYCVRSLLDRGAPSNAGITRPVHLVLPEQSIVAATPPHAVSAGNVETSQRITDVCLRALAEALPGRIPASSAGTMNNFTFGGSRPDGPPFASYETIPGGAGGGPTRPGASGIQTHMTNTSNTPVEAVESAFPIRVQRFELRAGSGGDGLHPGGDGVVKEVEFLAPASIAIISDRRRVPPPGLEGGVPGATGRNRVVRADGAVEELPASVQFQVQPGDVVRIETPGGGGWGEAAVPPSHERYTLPSE